MTGASTLETRQVRIVQSDAEQVVISSRVGLPPDIEPAEPPETTGQGGKPTLLRSTPTQGLQPGDRVVTSPIAYYVEGMPVQLMADE